MKDQQLFEVLSQSDSYRSIVDLATELKCSESMVYKSIKSLASSAAGGVLSGAATR